MLEGDIVAKIDEFKLFVKKHPELISHVRSGEMNWQKFYEIYDLYGESDEAWRGYFREEVKVEKVVNSSKNVAWSDLIEMAKKVDMDVIQNGVSSLQKALGLFGELFSSSTSDIKDSSYEPRPVYRRFDD